MLSVSLKKVPGWSALTLAFLAASTSLTAQGTIYTWYGDTAYDGMGRSVAIIGDIDSPPDGFAEVLTGAPLDGATAQDAGMARVFDGQTGNIRNTYYAGAAFDEFGYSVSAAGDVDNDGTPDFAIGIPRDDTNGNGSGTVEVYSGRTFLMLYSYSGAAAKDFVGWSIDGGKDVNNDGHAEIIVGAWQYDPGINPGSGIGYAVVLDGQASVNAGSGVVLYTWAGDNNTNFFGHDVTCLDDIDNDGIPDFAVGAYGDDNNGNNSGSVRFFSGGNGAVIRTVDGPTAGDKFGISLASTGDIDHDGFDDCIVGAEGDNTNGNNAGAAYLISGSTGATLFSWLGQAQGDFFGKRVAGNVGDIDGNGCPDVFIAFRGDDSNGSNSGAAVAYAGETGLEIFTVYGDLEHEVLGWDVNGGGDVNNDGVPDVVAGGSQYNNGPGPGNGIVRVFDPTGTPPPPPPTWQTLPGTFVTIDTFGYFDDFESYAGVVPSHFGINALNSLTRQASNDAWCNIGQNGPVVGGNSGIGPHQGTYGLEMGLEPNSTVNSNMSNALILGLDGSGLGDLSMNLWVYDHGEENNNDDGIFVSSNGSDWINVINWNGITDNTWTQLTGIDLSETNTGVSTNGQFYLAIAQQDNNPLGSGDGVSIDEIEVVPNNVPPLLSVSNFNAGVQATLMVENADPGDLIIMAYSLAGAGPTPVPGVGDVLLSQPIQQFPNQTANGAGEASVTFFIPPGTTGTPVWFHAYDQTQGVLTNALAEVIG